MQAAVMQLWKMVKSIFKVEMPVGPRRCFWKIHTFETCIVCGELMIRRKLAMVPEWHKAPEHRLDYQIGTFLVFFYVDRLKQNGSVSSWWNISWRRIMATTRCISPFRNLAAFGDNCASIRHQFWRQSAASSSTHYDNLDFFYPRSFRGQICLKKK